MRIAALAAGLALLVVAAPAHAEKQRVLCRFADSRIDESSSLVTDGRRLLTANDSGDSARVFLIDRETCTTVGVTTFSAEVVDVEALAAGPANTLWVGDIGDNNGVRSHISLYRMPMPRPGEHSVSVTTYDLVYPDRAHDAETLLVSPVDGRVYVVTKGLLGGTAYAAPRELRSDRTNVLRAVGSVPGVVTDGEFFADGRHVVLRDYWSATVLTAPGFEAVDSFPLPSQPQGEGVAIDGAALLLSSEGPHAAVLSTPIPSRVLRATRPVLPEAPSATGKPATDPSPAQDVPSDPAVDAPGSPRDRRWSLAAGAACVVALGAATGWWLRRRRAG